ncbi:MAG: GNAT family N-acetyltransferase [Acidothermaceae bacterium]
MNDTSAVVIRHARDGDIDRLVELLSLGTLRPDQESIDDRESYARALAEIAAAPYNELLVAERDGQVVGTCQVFGVRQFHHRGGLCAEIEGVHVHPDVRGQGVGSLLIDRAVDVARAWGSYRVQLTSNKVRTEAHRFYARLGFTATHEGFKRPLP